MLDQVNALIMAAMAAFSPAADLDVVQVRCMADNIYFEGRAEGMAGQMAIALVTMNRVESTFYPNTVCKVVKQGPRYRKRPDLPVRWKCQFSWWCDGKSDRIPLTYTKGKRKDQIRQAVHNTYSEVTRNAILVMAGRVTDFTEGATHYYAHRITTPYWSESVKMVRTTIIDDHTFMKPKAKMADAAPGATDNP